MCYSKDDGGYRCMPPQSLLNAYKGSPNNDYAPRESNGAFWLNQSDPAPHLMEIQDEAESLGTIIFMIEDTVKLESEISHLGNMIAKYSDSKVEDFDRRLKHAQDLGFKYNQAYSGNMSSAELERLRVKAIDANLALSYESRYHLQETLEQVSHFGHTLNVDIPDDDGIGPEFRPAFNDALRRASTAYPSTWNRALEDRLQLTYVFKNENSSFNRFNNEIKISHDDVKFVSYSSLAEAQKARAEDEFAYATHVEMVHELAHKFEFVQPDIVRASRSFLKRRALPGQHIHFDGNRVVKDHFTWDYAGQLWGNRHTEVFSVGMESTMLGTQGASIGLALPDDEYSPTIRHYRPDIEHRNLILGILASVSIPFNNDNKGMPVDTMFGPVEPMPFR